MNNEQAVQLPNGVLLWRDVACPMRDGTQLQSDVYRPAGQDSYPVLLLRTPYGKESAQANDVLTYAHPSWFAAQGYIVVVQNVRGRYSSEGVFYPLVNELNDGYDAVEWCTHLPGAQAAVGMYGMSYPGYVQLAAAGSGHSALKCIAPGCTSADAYRWAANESVPRLAFVLGWGLGLAHDEAVRQGNRADALRLSQLGRDPGAIFAQMPLLGSPEVELILKYMPFVADWLTHLDGNDPYWEKQRFAAAQIPSLYIAGWYDIWLKETAELFLDQRSRDASTRLLVGPWMHVPWRGAVWPDCNHCAPELEPSINHLLLEWFNWHLKGQKPASWLASEPACWFDYGDGSWKTGEFRRQGKELNLRLGSDGLATVSNSGVLKTETAPSPEAFDTLVSNPLGPTPSVGGWSCCYESVAPMGPKDQSFVEDLSQVAVYTAGALANGARLAGMPSVELDLTVERLPVTIVTTLCLVRGGRSINIARGVARLEAEGQSTSGWRKINSLRIELSPVSMTLDSRDQLRLQVATSSFPELAVDPQADVPFAKASQTDVQTATVLIHHGDGAASQLCLFLAGD